MEPETKHLLLRYRDGDEAAAGELYQLYVSRLIGLARSRMSERLAQRVDAEDVVQSVYRSFFAKAQEGRFELRRSGDLWRLLSAITVKKVLKKAEFHQAGKRDYRREQRAADASENEIGDGELFAVDPTDEDAVAVIEELESVMSALEPKRREMLERRLQGRRTLAGLKEELRQRLVGT